MVPLAGHLRIEEDGDLRHYSVGKMIRFRYSIQV
jgi:hypothetical protein